MLSITLTMLAFCLLPLTAPAAAVLFQERESCAGDLSRDGTCALSIRGGFQYCQRGSSRDAGEKQETATVV